MAKPNFGAQFWLANASGVLTKASGVTSVKAPSTTIGTYDSTTHDSPDGMMEFEVEAVADPGTGSVTLDWEPGSATDALILEALGAREKRDFKIVANGSSGAQYELSGKILVLSYEPDNQTIQGKQQATISLKASGVLTWDAA